MLDKEIHSSDWSNNLPIRIHNSEIPIKQQGKKNIGASDYDVITGWQVAVR